LIHLTISGSSDNWYNSVLYLLLHSPFSSTAPKMHLRILLSNEQRDLSSVFVMSRSPRHTSLLVSLMFYISAVSFSLILEHYSSVLSYHWQSSALLWYLHSIGIISYTNSLHHRQNPLEST
jgi:hypothetical protein